MFERFTERARRLIFFARYEALNSGSQYLETEHLLLGLLREDKQLANRFLHSYGSVDEVRQEIGSPPAFPSCRNSDVPLSQQCKRVLVYSFQEAESRGQTVATAHILLGLLREENGLGAKLLRDRGLNRSSVREELQNENLLPAPHERRPPFTFRLTAVAPKLSAADPLYATGVHDGHGPDGRLITCRNMTMEQFAKQLPQIAAGYIRDATVVDATGMDGAWDFTLSFSPNGTGPRGLTLFEAIQGQMGLKLEASMGEEPPVG